MRITTIFIVVAAVLAGMGLIAIDPGIEDVHDIFEALTFDFAVSPAILSGPTVVTGQATQVFVQAPADVPRDPQCTETDGGDDPYTLGVVTVISSESVQELVDACEGDVLLEYYCDSARLHSYKKPCTYGCWQGICRNAPMQTASDMDSPGAQVVDRADVRVVQGALEPRWVEPADIPACKNGFKDGKETDVDCSGPCKPCTYSQMCKQDTDCTSDLFCNYRSKRCLKTRY